MPIRSYVDVDFNAIIKSVIKDDILELNPVIAGGFPLAIYRSLDLYSKPHNRAILLNSINSSSKIYSSRLEKFGDIDCWFLKDTLNGLSVKEYVQSRLRPASNWRSSKWCISIGRRESVEYQFVLKEFDSPERLLSSFDLQNVGIAWHDNRLYVDSGVDLCIRSMIISKNQDFFFPEEDSLMMRIFRCLRFFKYAERTGFEFSDEISSYVYKAYFDAKHLDLNNLSTSTESIQSSLSAWGYFENSCSAKDIVYRFVEQFKNFVKMKSFKDEYLLYLIDSTLLSNVVERAIKNGGAASYRFHSNTMFLNSKIKSSISNSPFFKNNIPF